MKRLIVMIDLRDKSGLYNAAINAFFKQLKKRVLSGIVDNEESEIAHSYKGQKITVGKLIVSDVEPATVTDSNCNAGAAEGVVCDACKTVHDGKENPMSKKKRELIEDKGYKESKSICPQCGSQHGVLHLGSDMICARCGLAYELNVFDKDTGSDWGNPIEQ